MQSTTTLNLNLQHPNYTVVAHAVQNDRLARKIQATLADGDAAWTPPTGTVGLVRFTKPDGTKGFYDTDEDNNAAVTWTGNVATIMLAEQVLTVPGNVLVQINFYNASNERLSTFSFVIKVQECVIDDNTIVSTDYFNILTQRITDLLSAVANPPQIAQNGNWLVWDSETNAYVDSGVHAQGETGATGATGASMSGITKISGTGAGGTVDVYEVDLSNGSTAGTFNVYNGADGQGSPGSATPLMDGTAAVGSAIAYSREDHRHPTDTSRAAVASPTFTGTPSAPTASAGTNTTQIATTAFVSTAISNLPNVSTLAYVEVTS